MCAQCSPPTIRHDGSVEERRGCTAPWDSQSDQEHHHERCHHRRPHRQGRPGDQGESQHGHVRGDNSTVEYQGIKFVLLIFNLYICKKRFTGFIMTTTFLLISFNLVYKGRVKKWTSFTCIPFLPVWYANSVELWSGNWSTLSVL